MAQLARHIDLYATYYRDACQELRDIAIFEQDLGSTKHFTAEQAEDYNAHVERYNTYVNGMWRHAYTLRELGILVTKHEKYEQARKIETAA